MATEYSFLFFEVEIRCVKSLAPYKVERALCSGDGKFKTRRISVQFLTHSRPGRLVKDITYSWTLGGNRPSNTGMGYTVPTANHFQIGYSNRLGAMMCKLCGDASGSLILNPL